MVRAFVNNMTINLPTIIIALVAIATVVYQMGRFVSRVEAKFDQIDTKFEQMDIRFEQMDTRFEQIDKSLAIVIEAQANMDKRLAELASETKQLNQNFIGHLQHDHGIKI